MPKHGGFGMGMERLTMMLLGIENIRETTLFPSDPKRIAGVKIASKVFFGETLFPEITRRLKKNAIAFESMHHEPVETSEQAASVRGTELGVGVKAIILRSKKGNKNIMACVPADQKLELKSLESLLIDKFEFETPEQIKDKYGLEVGAIPPFGNLLGLNVYFSPEISKKDKVAFNAGTRTDSIIMSGKDLVKMVQAEIL
jgi:nondiscriminating aspartyl-tRNA synthetase